MGSNNLSLLVTELQQEGRGSMNTRVSAVSYYHDNQAIISQNNVHFNWHLLNYDLLEDRRIDDVINIRSSSQQHGIYLLSRSQLPIIHFDAIAYTLNNNIHNLSQNSSAVSRILE